MEGLAAAASCIGVVSLAIQLVDTVERIHHFFQKVIETPKELQRLKDLLEQLELILQSVWVVFKEEHSKGHGVTVFSKSIFKALVTCQKDLKILEGFIQNAKSVDKGKGKVSRALGSLKFATKEEDIKEFELHLQHALTTLNLTMTANMSHVQNRNTNRIISTLESIVTKQIALLRCDITSTTKDLEIYPRVNDRMEATKRYNPGSRSTSLQVSRRQSTATSSYETPLGTIYVRQRNAAISFNQDYECSTNNTFTRTERTWSFFPTFLSYCIRLQHRSYESILPSLQTLPRIMESSHPIYSICGRGDCVAFQAYLSSNPGFSPFAVDPSGHGLLHLAVICEQYDLCKLLLDLGLRSTSAIDCDGNEALWALRFQNPKVWRSPKSILRLFVSRDPDSVERSGLLFWTEYRVDEFEYIVEDWVTRDNVNLFEDSPLLCALRSIKADEDYLNWQYYLDRKYGPDPQYCLDRGYPLDGVYPLNRQYHLEWEKLLEQWKMAIRRLVRLGADIHQQADTSRLRLLYEILATARTPFDSQDLFEIWLDVLSSSDIDVAHYLKIELDFHHKASPFIEDLETRPRRIIFDITGRPRLYWDWWIDPQSPAYEVLEEFKYFGPTAHNPCENSWLATGGYEENAPFVYYQFYEKMVSKDATIYYVEKPEHIVAQRRFEKRMHKKAVKLAKAQGLCMKVPRLPGAWIE